MRSSDENAFFNEAYSESVRSSVWKYYVLIEGCRRFYRQYLLAHCTGRKVLEYGCGIGSYAFDLSRQGAEVIGIDISDVAISTAEDQARKKNLSSITFMVMDAENMAFPDRQFHLVCGTAILHHLNLDTAMSELVRVLDEDGSAAFLEPLGHNPALVLFRMLTPRLRTKDEHPLTVRDFNVIRRYFAKVDVHYFALFSMLAIPFLNTRAFRSVLTPLEKFDHFIFRALPWTGRFAWYSAMILSQPRRAGAADGAG